MIPGEYLLSTDEIDANVNRRTFTISVLHTGDRPIQVGSHYHFYEVNRALQFNRSLALGMHLNIAAGTAIRFEPGEKKEVTLVTFANDIKEGGLAQIKDNV